MTAAEPASGGRCPTGRSTVTRLPRRWREARARLGRGLLLAGVLASGPASAEDEPLHPRILAELDSKPVDCPADLPGAESCGSFHAGFSTFKFELEFELGLGDYQAEPLTPWKLLHGIYARTYRVGERIVSVGFDPKRRLIILKRGVPPKDESGTTENAPKGGPVDGAPAGGDDDDDDDDAPGPQEMSTPA